MKKQTRNYIILVLTILFIVFLTTKLNYYFGSDTDWINQHIIFPDYFRNMFYETNSILPNLSLNYGSGQNIYNISYYGLLSPIILISYLFPHLSMTTYTIVSCILILIISSIMFYNWIKSHNNSDNLSLVISLIFILSSPLIFHMHRHIMFVNYMPFLLLSLIGVDKLINNNKKITLILGVFLTIMTSYYFSVTSIIVVSLYYLYRLLNKNLSNKEIILNILKYILYIIISILLSSIILLPTLYTLLLGRGESTNAYNLINLLIPKIKAHKYFIGTYSIGVSLLGFISLIYLYITKKKSNIILGVLTSIILFIPIFMYLLNGLLYLREKCFIPFIPLLCYIINIFLQDLHNKKVNTKLLIPLLSIIFILLYIKYKSIYYIYIIPFIILLILYNKYNYKKLFTIYIVLIPFIMTCYETTKEERVSYEYYNTIFNKDYEKEIISTLNNDTTSIYRSSNLLYPTKTVNKIYTPNYYSTSLYSSTYNKSYLDFIRNEFNLSMEEYNYFMIPSSSNILFNKYMGIKYVFSPYPLELGYTKINTNTYLIDDTYTMIYSSNNLINIDDYNKLTYPYKVDTLLNNIVVSTSSNNTISSNIKETNITYTLEESNGVTINKDNNNKYTLEVKENGYIKLKLDKILHNQILFIDLEGLTENTCKIPNITMTINNVKNLLTCRTWGYSNKNNTFSYVIGDTSLEYLDIYLTKGKYTISNIKTYTLDYNYVTTSNITKSSNITYKNNKLSTSIDIKVDDSYLVTTLPYDKGYTIKIDNIVVPYTKVNTSFIGLPISKGHHTIEITYKTPLIKESIILSILGLLLTLIIQIKDMKNTK